MEMMAENFPGAFAGYTLEVKESHQRNKVDTSGTAKAVVASFQQLGLDFQEVSFLAVLDCASHAGSGTGTCTCTVIWPARPLLM